MLSDIAAGGRAMLFNSLQFLIFFPVVTGIYFAVPHKARWMVLLAASALFYMAFIPIYIVILGFTIVTDYYAGILIDRASGARRRAWLTMSIAANVGVLAVFKYWNFLAGNVNGLLGATELSERVPILQILLPIGLSFHTFQAMSYTIEVYRGHQVPERHFGIYALYVMFYPQLVAGPIERPQNLLHQFRERHTFEPDRVWEGLMRMVSGLFKKAVVADRLAVFVGAVYANPQQHGPAALILATWCFAIQIYCDFSGYSDMALGAARVMGFSLMENFDRPYLSQSIGEFWRRWHISLSTWFKDYVYVPLGGSRSGLPKQCRNLMIVFLISGLWHGAAWTFVVWGALHGTFLIVSVLTAEARAKAAIRLGLARCPSLLTPLKVFLTFNLVSFAWIFFRANTVGDAMFIAHAVTVGAVYSLAHAGSFVSAMAFGAGLFRLRTLVWLVVAFVFLTLELGRSRWAAITTPKGLVWKRVVPVYVMVMLILVAGRFGATFIYFQF